MNHEWSGDWSDKSELWEKNPNVKEALHPSDKKDGCFWISDKDFNEHFSKVFITNYLKYQEDNGLDENLDDYNNWE